jgi:hypothetical protein
VRRVQTTSRTLVRYALCPFDHVLRPDFIAFLLRFGHLRYSKVRCTTILRTFLASNAPLRGFWPAQQADSLPIVALEQPYFAGKTPFARLRPITRGNPHGVYMPPRNDTLGNPYIRLPSALGPSPSHGDGLRAPFYLAAGLQEWWLTRSHERGPLPSSRIPSSVFSLAIPGSRGLEGSSTVPMGRLTKPGG